MRDTRPACYLRRGLNIFRALFPGLANVLLLGLSLGETTWAQSVPVGTEFQVNSYTTAYQRFPAVSPDGAGGVVVVWQSSGSAGTDTSAGSIQGQRYASSGLPVGSEFQVNAYTTSGQVAPAVAPDGAGGFVVVWASGGSAGSDTSSSSVQGQRFDSTGVPVGVQFQVNTYTTNGQGLPLVGSDGPAVAPDGTGGFVVVWTSGGFGYPGPDGSETSIHGQRYASAGAPIGGEFQVNTYTTSYQYAPAAGPDGGGGFVVMWSGRGMSDDFGVWGQRYDGAGLPVGSEFQINTYTTSTQGHPKVAPDGAGGFVVTWVSQGSSGSDPGSSIQGQRYSSAGAPVGAEFQVNTYTTGNQDLYGTGHAVAPDGAGGFVVTWTSFGSSGSDTGPNADASIQGQRYGSTGAPIGGQFQVNTNTMYNQYYPAVAPDGAGGFVVVWQSYYIIGSSDFWSIHGQRYAPQSSTTTTPTTTSTSTTSTTLPTCANGILEAGEACDDGDAFFLDGCTPTCTVEAGWACSGSPSVCAETCGFGAGNGVINAGEECDDGFPNEDGDGCAGNCFIEAGWSCAGAPSVCTQICGDGIVTAGQQCDDDDTDNGDGCSSTCTIEAGWVCSGQPSTCANTCGDGNIDAGEQCDDMDTGGGDGCSPICRLESGWSCSGVPSSCAATCGDGSLQAGEDCDDGDTNNGNGCSNICRDNLGWSCDASQPSVCTTVCGDGVRIKIAEDCEDGCLTGTPNVCEPADDGDGCEANCTLTEKSVSDTVGAGGTVTTDVEGDGATITDPLEVSVTSPVAGTITITRRATSGPAPSGFTYAGQEVDITAPPATVADPHVIVFRLHPDLVPEGLIGVVEILTVFKDGVVVPDCTAPGTGDAVPDPCVASRVALSDLDFQITVFSSTASVWNFGFEITALPLLSPAGALVLAGLLVLALGVLLPRRPVVQ